MITVIPVRFSTNRDPSSVWSQELLENWLQPLREYSLGIFWWLSSGGYITPEASVSSPIVIDDPRTNAGDPAQRATLAQAAIDSAAATVRPDWEATDVVLLWFAQKTDAFGGQGATVPLPGGGTKQVLVTGLDLDAEFDVCAQELGHSLGFGHELGAAGNEYASPYSSMSCRTTSTLEFVRPSIKGLPDGAITGAAGRANPPNTAVQQIVGPRIPGAQFYKLDSFRNSSSVVTLPADWGRAPVTLRLYPPNYQSRHPQPPPRLVAVPSCKPNEQRLFLVEFRRGGFDYDQGIRGGAAGLTVHSINPDGRIRYDGVASVARFAEMRDWVCEAGNFVLRYDGLDTNQEFADIQIRAGSQELFPIRGVLLVGRFRTQRQLNEMTHDDMRNTLIVELAAHSNQRDYQRFDNDTLAGMGAAMVFLRKYKLRSDAELAAMSADDQRNVLIVEIGGQTALGQDLQGVSNLDLIRTVLGSDILTAGRAPGVVGSYLRGVLLLGGFRGQHELNMMSLDDMRNTVIVELTKRTSGRNYQAYSNPDLEGAGAVLVAVRHLGVVDDAKLATMSVDSMRNALIVELDRQTGMGQRLQGVTNVQLAMIALGIEPPH